MASSLKKVEDEVHTLISKIKITESPQHKTNRKSEEKVLEVSSNTRRVVPSGNMYEGSKEKKRIKEKNSLF